MENNKAFTLTNECKLLFFDSIEHLPIHLLFEAKVEGSVQYRWMYPLERLDITVAM
jgi:hypothetical protein